MLTLTQLALYLRTELEPSIAALPKTVAWPTSDAIKVCDYSDSGLGFYCGTVVVNSVQWDIMPDDARGRSPVDALSAAWSIEIDETTGNVWAVPTFSGATVTKGPGTIADLFAAVGLGKRLIATLGTLRRFGNIDAERARSISGMLDIAPQLFAYVRASDREKMLRDLESIL